MSQRDLLAEIRASSAPAPAALRARVRRLEPPPPRRLPWQRRALVVAVPVAAAVAAAVAVVVTTRPAHRTAHAPQVLARAAADKGMAPAGAGSAGGFAVPTTPRRPQRVETSLTLRVRDDAALSNAVRGATTLVASLGGHARSLHVAGGAATLVYAVPRAHVDAAVTRLGRLGTIVGEQVDVQDLGSSLAASDRTIARLQRQLKALRAQPPTTANVRRIVALTARVAALQRAEAATRRGAHFATVTLLLHTPARAVVHHRHGPLHGLLVALRWTGIGLVYALVFGLPLALLWLGVRLLRRRRDDALLGLG